MPFILLTTTTKTMIMTTAEAVTATATATATSSAEATATAIAASEISTMKSEGSFNNISLRELEDVFGLENLEEIFLKHNVADPINDIPSCESEELEIIICPSDEKAPCSSNKEDIEEHCAALLAFGSNWREILLDVNENKNENDNDNDSNSQTTEEKEEDTYNTYKDKYIKSKLPIFRGCIIYCSYHFKDVDEYNGCCSTEYCENWLDEKIAG